MLGAAIVTTDGLLDTLAKRKRKRNGGEEETYVIGFKADISLLLKVSHDSVDPGHADADADAVTDIQRRAFDTSFIVTANHAAAVMETSADDDSTAAIPYTTPTTTTSSDATTTDTIPADVDPAARRRNCGRHLALNLKKEKRKPIVEA